MLRNYLVATCVDVVHVVVMDDGADKILDAMAAGDAFGLPFEGLPPGKRNPEHQFFFGWGLTSDDTQHAAITMQSLLRAGKTPDSFAKSLSRGLCLWFLCLPPGIGFATLRACLKLCVGVSPQRSGVDSAGNGPAMRAPVIGWMLAGNDEIDAFVDASTELTHTHRIAKQGARAIAKAVSLAKTNPTISKRGFLEATFPEGDGWTELRMAALDGKAIHHIFPGGVSGFMPNTVCACLLVAEKYRADLEGAVSEVVNAGGDTDSTGAITSAICCAFGGQVPAKWRKTLDYPGSVLPGASRLFWNVLGTFWILAWHVPLRTLGRVTRLVRGRNDT